MLWVALPMLSICDVHTAYHRHFIMSIWSSTLGMPRSKPLRDSIKTHFSLSLSHALGNYQLEKLRKIMPHGLTAHHKSSRDGLQAAATSFAETCVAHSVRRTDVSTHPAAFTPAKLPRYLLGDSRQMIKVVAFINFISFFFCV